MRQGNSARWATGNEDLGAEVDAHLRALASGLSSLSMLTNRNTVGLIETGRVMTFRENFELLGILMGDRGLMLDLCCA